jgi:hypothetical protein
MQPVDQLGQQIVPDGIGLGGKIGQLFISDALGHLYSQVKENCNADGDELFFQRTIKDIDFREHGPLSIAVLFSRGARWGRWEFYK